MADQRDPDMKKVLRGLDEIKRQIERLQAQMQTMAPDADPEQERVKPNRFTWFDAL